MSDSPMVLGPFVLDKALTITLQGSAANYGFRFRDRVVHASLGENGLRLEVELGRVPSSAHGAASRRHLLATLANLPNMLPPEWQLVLRPDHRLDVATLLPVHWPLSAVDLVVAKTGFLLALGPYLDVLEEAGVAN